MHIIELEDEELQLIGKALDLYSRVGLGQFQYLDINETVMNRTYNILTEDEFDQFNGLIEDLRRTYSRMNHGGSFGIFSKKVGDDCRIAADIYQSIRHHLWKQRPETDKRNHTVDAYPADICKIANIKTNFKIK